MSADTVDTPTDLAIEARINRLTFEFKTLRTRLELAVSLLKCLIVLAAVTLVTVIIQLVTTTVYIHSLQQKVDETGVLINELRTSARGP